MIGRKGGQRHLAKTAATRPCNHHAPHIRMKSNETDGGRVIASPRMVLPVWGSWRCFDLSSARLYQVRWTQAKAGWHTAKTLASGLAAHNCECAR